MPQSRSAQVTSPSRRMVLQYGAVLGGGLAIGLVPAGRGMAQSPAQDPDWPGQPEEAFVYWLKITPDNQITLIMHMAEMGQGVSTTLPQLMAEELNLDWDQVQIELAPNGPAYVNRGYALPLENTGGSASIRGTFDHLRQVGAMAREMLVQAASEAWGVEAGSCTTDKAVISHAASGRRLTFGEVADAAARQAPPQAPLLKPKSQWRVLGKSVPRLDVPAKTDGSAPFGMDTRLDGMLFAAIRHAPRWGDQLASVDHGPALKKAGVEAVVELDDAVTVLAGSYWQAKTALDALEPLWTDGPLVGFNQEDLEAELDAALARKDAPIASEAGDVTSARQAADQVVSAEYGAPYLAHMCMEPMNATVSVTERGVDVYVSTQSNSTIIDGIAAALDIPKDSISVHRTYLGGGFGRRGEPDVSVQAAILSAAVGRPVQLIWSREEDVRRDFYRPAARVRCEAGLDNRGYPVFFDVTAACQSISARRFPEFFRGDMDFGALSGFLDSPYDIANWQARYAIQKRGAPVGYWRAVGHSQNIFFRECFIDELAAAAGEDPLAYRRRLLQDDPRYQALFDAIETLSNWSDELPDGHARGLAMNNSHGSLCAQVVELSQADDGLAVHRISCVLDPGLALHPDILTTQMEGSILDGLSAAVFGQVTIEDGGLAQSNFHDARFLSLAESPAVDVRIVEWVDAQPGGAGEPGLPPLAPALANALYAATGQRQRQMPLGQGLLNI